MSHITVTDADFDEKVLGSDVPVLVDFWAPWCGPCRMVAPTLEKLGEEYDGKMIVAKLNVDENQMIAGRYGIMSIPTMKIFKGGEEVDNIVGALPEPIIRDKFEYWSTNSGK